MIRQRLVYLFCARAASFVIHSVNKEPECYICLRSARKWFAPLTQALETDPDAIDKDEWKKQKTVVKLVKQLNFLGHGLAAKPIETGVSRKRKVSLSGAHDDAIFTLFIQRASKPSRTSFYDKTTKVNTQIHVVDPETTLQFKYSATTMVHFRGPCLLKSRVVYILQGLTAYFCMARDEVGSIFWRKKSATRVVLPRGSWTRRTRK